jgi:hypothetical protein
VLAKSSLSWASSGDSAVALVLVKSSPSGASASAQGSDGARQAGRLD